MKKILLNRVIKNHKSPIYALVDDDDYEFLNQFNWYLTPKNHVKGAFPFFSKRMFMHRFMACLFDTNIHVDHIDGNGLNNQKSNLRPCTNSENSRNRRPWGASKYLGVYKMRDRWGSSIKSNGTVIFLGVFRCEVAAALAYDKAAKKYHKEFARLNFPNKDSITSVLDAVKR